MTDTAEKLRQLALLQRDIQVLEWKAIGAAMTGQWNEQLDQELATLYAARYRLLGE